VRSLFLVFVIAGGWVLLASGQTQKSAPHPRAAAACGPLDAQSFRCPKFGFTYKVPFGWVDRTSDLQDDTEDAAGKTAPRSGSETLLAVFERPPGAPGETINSAVVIAAESLAGYPGLKTAADYFGPITEIAEQQGFKAEDGLYSFPVGAKQLVRGDFSKMRGKLEMRQSSLVMIAKGNIISFTFIAGSKDEVEDLIGSLSFGVRSPAR
jgi:hypothetical protein